MTVKSSNKKEHFRLGLVSMPWSIFNRPSIQLAALKAFLDRDDTLVTTLFHPYLTAAAAIGTENYHYLAKNSWAGEALYSPMLFPEQSKSAEKFFVESCRKEKNLRQLNFADCGQLLEQALEQWIASVDFSSFDLIGFSICFNQLISSLTAASRIKKLYPELPIVFGGSGCVGEIGKSLLHNFPHIDYVISGEGEEALQQLCHALKSPADAGALPSRILTKKAQGLVKSNCAGIEDINSLPVPDFAPYFREMHKIFPQQPFVPVLPVEFSRGCWWNKCTFCNLNLQWCGYRWKTAQNMLEEVKQQSSQYQCLDFCFTDNALPPKEADIFFTSLAKEKTNFDFFAEVRVITDPDKPRLYRLGGLSTVQVGIESLSTSLLKKMKKGATAIENIAAMRQSAEAGIALDGNLIIEFPGSTEKEVQETLNNLDFVLPFFPLASASFFLGHGSPVAADPGRYGILAVTHHNGNKKLFPEKLLKNLTMLIKDYRGDRVLQRKNWKEVSEKINAWQDFHKTRNPLKPALLYRDGSSFLLIRQEQINGPPLQHRLQGMSRKIYLFCREIRKFDAIIQEFPKIKPVTLRTFLEDLCSKKLMFNENGLFLALAINQE
ncbi:MAG TPA: RiPP maturation radical SAM protein 1 [Desulfobacterales bacterium]|nr:RiPP maturation radical SAM protein 1 [Desulfobacterales bacterium]